MRGKILFVAGAAVGYVLGARAGRKRYEQISAAASKVWHTDSVQGAVSTAEGYAKAQLGGLADKALEGVKTIVVKALGSGKTTATPASYASTPGPVSTPAPAAAPKPKSTPTSAAKKASTATSASAKPIDDADESDA